jgi:tetratricopeptide (TPR) repeat protein
LLLALLTAAVYARAVTNDFVDWDDEPYVTDNEFVLDGLAGRSIAWAWDFDTEHGGNWHPLTSMSHMLDVELFAVDPAGHHAVNVVLHVLNTLLLFGLLFWSTRARWPAAVVAALFALHPLHVESVAWVSERKDVLSTAFGLGALWAYAAWTRGGSWSRYVLALVLFACGLMSKPMLVTWPFVLLLFDHWPLGRWPGVSLRRLLLEKLPFFALSGASAAVTFLVQRTAGAVTSDKVAFPHRLENVLISYVRYLGKTFWPDDFTCLYPHTYGLAGNPWPWWGLLLGGLLLLGVTGLALRSRRYALVGWLWYLGTLVPVIGFVQVGSQGMADRYTYVPLIGVFVMIAYGGADLARRQEGRGSAGGSLKTVGAVTALVVAALSVRTFVQIGVWRDSRTLFENAVRVEPSPITASNLGTVYRELGMTEEALNTLRYAIEISEEHAPGHFNLGVVLHEEGRHEEAEAAYRATIDLDPNYALARRNLGIVLLELGENEEAVGELRIAEALEYDDADTHFKLGQAWNAVGQKEAAIRSLREAVRLNPEHPVAYLDLGTLLEGRGEYAEAKEILTKAVAIDPWSNVAVHNLGVTLGRLGENEEALAAYRKSLELEPSYTRAHNNIASLLRAQHRFEETIPHYEALIALQPSDPAPHHGLGLVYQALNRPPDRIRHLREAVRLGGTNAELPLAWALATACEEEHRGPAEALELATAVVGRLSVDAVGPLDVLAAAQASAGRYQEAIATIERALKIADPRQTSVLNQRLARYQSGEAYVQCR